MQKTLISIVLLFLANISIADEIRPGYLELNEESPNTYSILWKVPKKSGQTLSLEPHFPADCINKTAITSHTINGATLQRWYINCTNNIVGQRISIEDSGNSNTDVLLRLKWLDGTVSTSLLKPSAPFYIIPEKSTATAISITYLRLVSDHILLGFYHLLFIFALLLIVNSTRRLILSITAFTIAHCITLACATLGFFHVPQQPV